MQRQSTPQLRRLLALSCSAAILSISGIAGAGTTWDPAVPGGSWSIPANWLGGIVPLAGGVTIAFNDALAHAVTYDVSFNDPTTNFFASSIYLSNAGSGSVLLNFSGYDFVGPCLALGGNAMVRQSAGNVNAGIATIGVSSNGVGTYEMLGGTLDATRLLIGVAGPGVVRQEAGTVSIERSMINYLDLSGDYPGRYEMNGGTLIVDDRIQVFNGTFTQTGGTVVVKSTSPIYGVDAAFSGAFELQGGTLLTNMVRGRILQTGGYHQVGFDGNVGSFEGSYYLTDGSLQVNGDMHLGSSFYQKGGTNTIGDAASPRTLFIQRGLYALESDGVLRDTGTLQIQFGQFSQRGGLHQLGSVEAPSMLRIGGAGQYSYSLEGGTFETIGSERIGDFREGTFNQSGGIHRLGAAALPGEMYVSYGPNGQYLLRGGTLQTIGTEYIGEFGVGTFQQTNGTHLLSGTLQIGATGTYLFNGGTFSVDGAIQTAGLLGIGSTAVSRTLLTSSLAIAGSGQVDLTDNQIIIDYPLASPVLDVTDYLRAGYNNGSWNGTGGIVSSLAAADPTHGIGYTDDGDQLHLKYALAADANLDGRVDLSDLYALASHWRSGALWSGGDFDYSKFVDAKDLGILARTWQMGAASPSSEPLDSLLASLGLPSVEVPEPACVGAITLLSLSLGYRSRENCRAGERERGRRGEREGGIGIHSILLFSHSSSVTSTPEP
jgi:hypothetical protein